MDLSNQVVRVLGSTPVKIMTEALEQTGRKARLIGQGVPEGSSFPYPCPLWILNSCLYGRNIIAQV